MQFHDHIFKAYDIRGLVDKELTPELAYGIGRATVQLLREKGASLEGKSLVVGYDMRPSSPVYQKEIVRAITDEGVNVVDIGLTSTPVFNFACAHYPEHVAGIMVTASHNPAEYNGFKITMADGLPVGQQTGMDRVRDLAKAGDFIDAEKKGDVRAFDVRPDYMTKLFELVKKDSLKPLKIVVDAGNGMAKAILPEVLKQVPVEAEYLFLEPDGTFPNHEANPLKVETLRDLQKKVVDTGADFGFALDGDADRIGLVDEKGAVVDASFVGALLGREILRVHGSGKMFYDLRSSKIVAETWAAAGGDPDMCMVGHANIKKLMKETGAIFASELSMHLFYHDLYDLESSDLSLLLVLQMLSREEKPLSELVVPLKKYCHSGEINFEVEDKAGAMARIEETLGSEAVRTTRLDGVWMEFEWGWLSVRASNTEPVLRLNLETSSEEQTREKVAEVTALIVGTGERVLTLS